MTFPSHPEDHAWLSCVQWANDASGTPFGHVQPLAWRDDDNGRWVQLPEADAPHAFPDRGAVYWRSMPVGLGKDDLVVVHVERQRSYDAGKEAYLVRESRRPPWAVEAIDLRALADERSQRVALTQEGLAVSLASAHVLVRITDEEAVGPLELKRRDDGRWALDPEHPDLLQVVRLLNGDVAPVTVDRRRVDMVLAPDRVGAPVGFVNWSSDVDLAKSVLKRIQRLGKKPTPSSELSQRAFDDYLEAHPSFDFQSELQRQQEHARFSRVEELVRVVESDRDLLDQAARALVDHPAVAAALEEPKRQAVEAARNEAEQALRQEAEAQRRALEEELAAEREEAASALTETRKKLQEAESSRASAENAYAELQKAIDEARAHLNALAAETDQRVADAEAALASRLAELASRPAEAFAELAIIRALLPASPASPPPSQPTAAPGDSETVERVTWDDGISGRISARMGAPDHYVSPSLLAAFLAGRPVVVAGDAAHTALHALANVVAGGRTTWIPVAPTLSTPSDLLTLADPATGRVLPHPGGLLAAIQAAAASDEMALVVLEGFDRAACDHYLDPLLHVYADAGNGLGRTLPYVDPTGMPQRVAWPPNLLLACLPSGGPSALPPGRSFWKHALLVDAGDQAAGEGSGSPPTAMTLDAWLGLADVPSDGEVPDLSSPLEMGPAATRSAGALYRHVRALNVPEHEAHRIAYVGAVLPNATNAGDQLDEALARHVPDDRRPRVRHLFDHLLSL